MLQMLKHAVLTQQQRFTQKLAGNIRQGWPWPVITAVMSTWCFFIFDKYSDWNLFFKSDLQQI